MFCIGSRWHVVGILVIVVLVASYVPYYAFYVETKPGDILSQNSTNGSILSLNSSNISNVASFDNTVFNNASPTLTATPSLTATPAPASSGISRMSPAKPSSTAYISPVIEQPATTPRAELNESYLLSALEPLRATGGTIVLQNDLTIMNQDVLLPSNITLTGSDSKITIFLSGNRLGVAANATHVTIKNLTFDASGLDDLQAFTIGQNASKVELENICFQNYFGSQGCLLNLGNEVTLRNILFINVSNGIGIRNLGSFVSIRNCTSNDNSVLPLFFVAGGNHDIYVAGNQALNRPLLYVNWGSNPTRNLWIENNTNYFSSGTYSILIMGGMGDYLPVSNENVTVKGNFIKAAPGAFNAIAIYGLTTNATVIGNTVDMSLSGHNGIGVSSGTNITVTKNVVFGCTELTEGGIEIESNPVHNRQVGFSDNVKVFDNTVYDSDWGIYVRVMCPDHPNWNGTVLPSRNIVIENNTVFDCHVGVNLLDGFNLTVKNNNIESNKVPFVADALNVSNYTVIGNVGYA